jgi:MFS family permease
MLGQASQGITFTAFIGALPMIARSFSSGSHGAEIAQQAVTIAGIGLVIGSIVSGKIIEWIGARLTALAALVVFGVAGGGGMIAHSATIFLAGRVLIGFAAACLFTACITTISFAFHGNARAKALGLSGAAGSAGGFVGLLAGGVLAQWFGWRWAFVQYPIFAIAGLILAVAGMKDAKPQAVTDSGPASVFGGEQLPVYLLALIISAVLFLSSSQFAFLLSEDGVTTATGISHFQAVVTIAAVFASFAFGAAERLLGRDGVLLIGFLAEAGGLALTGLLSSVAGLVIGTTLLGCYVGLVVPYIYQLIAVKTAPGQRPKAIGFVAASIYLGTFINPFLFTPISARLGLHGLFVVVAVVIGLMALATLFIGNRSPQASV